MRIAVGHANPDFDAYASTVAATKLYPGTKGVFLGSQSANVQAFHNLHEEFLDFIDLRELDLTAVDSVVMVDTRDPRRVGPIGEIVMRQGVEVIVYDHHPAQEGDLARAIDRGRDVGATTSIMTHEIRDRGIELSVLEASLLLLGIHEDTGSLTYPNATAYDAQAAAWLMEIGADVEVLNQFLSRTLSPQQRGLLAQLESSLSVWDINGQSVAVSTARTDEYVDSAGVLTHYVVEDMGYRVAIAAIEMPDRTQLVARSRLPEVDVGAVMARLGGGGHAQAASAGFRDVSAADALDRVRDALAAEVRPPLTAGDVMTSPVRTIAPDTTMHQAAEMMARWGHGGLPVMHDGVLVGLVTRKDVDKAVRHNLEHAPVTGFIQSSVTTVSPQADLRDIESMLARRGIGRVPVLVDGRLVGIVTRKDVLRAEHGETYLTRGLPVAHPQARAAFVGSVDSLLTQPARHALRELGRVGDELGLTLHVVGGFVRDMVMGRCNTDIDVVVEGDGIAFALSAAKRLDVRVKVHQRFGTAVLIFGRDLHVDIATSRTEFYTKPGALPSVEPSSLTQDLFRRDFTINAMSACIDPDCFGAIADPYGGLTDIDRRSIRIMHALSFIDDPTRILRAVRFETRFGFRMDERTEALARHAVELDVIDEVSGSRVRDELMDIFAEEHAIASLERLAELGLLGSLCADGVEQSTALAHARQIAAAIPALSSVVTGRLDWRAVFSVALAYGGVDGAEMRWVRHLRMGRPLSMPVVSVCDAHGRSVSNTLRSKGRMRDSRLYRLLEPFSVESLVALWALGDETSKRRIERYIDILSRTSQSVSGDDLIAMGIQPGPEFAAILGQAHDDVLDGRVSGREQELANLRRLAHKAGLTPR